MSNSYLKNYIFIISFLSLIILVNGCSSDKELISDWTNKQIKIDGETSDWQSNLVYLSDDNVALGFKNDGKYLYICLTTNDFTKVLPMFRGGFIIWFEPENGGKTIGIKYPMHNILNNSEETPNLNERIYDRGNPSAFIEKMLERQNELQVLNEDKYPLTDIPAESNEGIRAKLRYHSDRFIYELQMPLNDNKYAYKIPALPGEKVKVKFETEETESKDFRGERSGSVRISGGEGGERPEGFGGEGRRGGMRPGMNKGGSFKPLNFSVELTLKKENSQLSGN
jgi:hypothetical protein